MNRDNFMGMVGWGLLGLFTGVGYKASHVYLMNRQRADKLQPKTDVLYTHDELFSMCLQLQKFRKFNEHEYNQFIINTDRLLYLLQIMQEDDFEKEPGDKKLAFSHFKTADTHIKNLYKTVHAEGSPKQVAALKQLYDKINHLNQKVWMQVIQRLSACE
jgi:hypothetical protein